MTGETSLLLTNARVGGEHLVDVRLDQGSVRAVGAAGSLGPREGTADEVVDLDGRYLIPGLWDAHVHFTTWVHNRLRLDVTGTHSASQVAAMVAERLHTNEPGATATVVGFGFRDALLLDVPSAAILDAVAPHQPVVLVAGDYHCVWVNTAAQQRYGLEHAGLLRETPAFEVQNLLALESQAIEHATLEQAARQAAARGVVGVVDLEMADNVTVWKDRIDAGLKTLRVRAGFYPEALDDMIQRRLRTGDVIPGTDGLLTVGPLKVITDGTLNTRTAYCHAPYPETGDLGMNTVPPEHLQALLVRATDHGFEAAVHAIGDQANTFALDAFEVTGARGSVEHAQLLTERDMARFAELGVVASMQPEHAMDDRDVADALWAGRTDRAFALASLHAAGARIALGSDAPVAPLDPWVTMSAAVGRTRDGREPWHPEQRVSNEVALAASGAHSPVCEGMDADLVVCERNPLTASPEALRTMPVAATLLSGVFTYRAGI